MPHLFYPNVFFSRGLHAWVGKISVQGKVEVCNYTLSMGLSSYTHGVIGRFTQCLLEGHTSDAVSRMFKRPELNIWKWIFSPDMEHR
jgi:hypothetical protein